MNVKTGKGEISLVVLVAILSVSAIVSLPGLAISPILDDLDKLIEKYKGLITCVCFMGGDQNIHEVVRCFQIIKCLCNLLRLH